MIRRIVQVISMDLSEAAPLVVLDDQGCLWRYSYCLGGGREWEPLNYQALPR